MSTDRHQSPPPAQRLRYAEDLRSGLTYELGRHHVSAQEIDAFARKWDPLDIHISRDAAEGLSFGGIIASGIHTLAIFQRMASLTLYRHWALVAGKKMRDVEMIRPVRPGDTLVGQLRIIDVNDHRRLGQSVVRSHGTLTTAGITVLRLELEAIVYNRPNSRRV